MEKGTGRISVDDNNHGSLLHSHDLWPQLIKILSNLGTISETKESRSCWCLIVKESLQWPKELRKKNQYKGGGDANFEAMAEIVEYR